MSNSFEALHHQENIRADMPEQAFMELLGFENEFHFQPSRYEKTKEGDTTTYVIRGKMPEEPHSNNNLDVTVTIVDNNGKVETTIWPEEIMHKMAA